MKLIQRYTIHSDASVRLNNYGDSSFSFCIEHYSGIIFQTARITSKLLKPIFSICSNNDYVMIAELLGSYFGVLHVLSTYYICKQTKLTVVTDNIRLALWCWEEKDYTTFYNTNIDILTPQLAGIIYAFKVLVKKYNIKILYYNKNKIKINNSNYLELGAINKYNDYHANKILTLQRGWEFSILIPDVLYDVAYILYPMLIKGKSIPTDIKLIHILKIGKKPFIKSEEISKKVAIKRSKRKNIRKDNGSRYKRVKIYEDFEE